MSDRQETRDGPASPLVIAGGILAVAATATAGDWIWYTFGVRHGMVVGVLHGAVLLTVVGGVLGLLAGRPLRGLPIGTVAGAGGALAYYALVALIDGRTYGTAIPAAWIVTWLLLAILEGRWLRAPHPRSWYEIAVRAFIAALAGGVAFALVRDVLWGRPGDGGRNYALQLVAWAFAWAPGLLALCGPASRTARTRAGQRSGGG